VGLSVTATVWLCSSRVWPDAGLAVTIDASLEAVTASLGGLYIVSPTAALNLMARMVVAMTSAGVVAPACFITEQRYVRLTSSGVFTVDWTSTVLRDYLGFTGNLAGASAYTAQLRSPLLWSPGKTETPELAPLGAHGQPIADISVAYGAGGTQTIRVEGDPTYRQRYQWAHVLKARYYSAPPTPVAGDYVYFWNSEFIGGNRWILLRGVTEGSSTTVSAGYGSATAAGPYKAMVQEMRAVQFDRSTGFARVEHSYDVSIPCVKTPEFA
jgi:hypothetical protein